MVNLLTYNSVGDYVNGVSTLSKLNCLESDFVRYLIFAGGYKNSPVSKQGELFYKHLVKMALIFKNGDFYSSSDYFNSETSIKTAISYFIGLLSSYAIADKVYNVPYLFHLKDHPVISNVKKKNRKTPDFFGLINGSINYPLLLEAKGTYKKKFADGTIKNAEQQLDTIKSLNYKISSRVYSISTFKGCITGSYFVDDKLHFCNIDPVVDGHIVYDFNADIEIISYYNNIMSLLYSNDSKYDTFEGVKYKLISFEDYKIGLNKEVFELLSTINSLSDCSGLYHSISEVSIGDYKKSNDSSISLGRDGLIVIKS